MNVPVPVPVPEMRNRVSGRADRGWMQLDHERLDVYELALEFVVQANGIIEGMPTARAAARARTPAHQQKRRRSFTDHRARSRSRNVHGTENSGTG